MLSGSLSAVHKPLAVYLKQGDLAEDQMTIGSNARLQAVLGRRIECIGMGQARIHQSFVHNDYITTLCTFIYMVGAIVPVVATPLLQRYSSLFDFNSIKYFFIIKLTEKLRLNSLSCKNIVHYQEFFRTGNKHDSKVN